MVSVKILKRDEVSISLVLSEVPLEYANAIRRSVLEEVPTMAIDYVVLYDNTSAQSDEMIAHRVSMIPLKSDNVLEKYKRPEECKSSSPPEGCYVSFYLEAETGPQEELVVYSGDLKPQDDPEVAPVYNNIPIIKLGPRQRVILEAWARLGRGREHIKWSPATVSVLTYIPVVKVDRSKCTLCRLCVESCPTRAINLENGTINVDEARCNLCRQCVKVCEPEAVDVDWKRDEYKLYIESSGALKPERIFLEAVLQVKRKLLEFQRGLEELFQARGGVL